jgi:outer membrane protein assembly factor BamE (lipoprotein component of BamABCDE complex)
MELRVRKLYSWPGALLFVAMVSLMACDPRGRAYEDVRLTQLTEGQSTEQDVRRLFGPPAAVRDERGAKGLVYPLGPEGSHTLVIRIDANGKYQGRENLLTRENFNRVSPGQKEADVLALLGPPGRTQQYALKQETAWEWRYLNGTETRLFVVMFDAHGAVVSTATEEDPRRQGGK